MMMFQKNLKKLVLVLCSFVGHLSLKAPHYNVFQDPQAIDAVAEIFFQAQQLLLLARSSEIGSPDATLFKKFPDGTVDFCLPRETFRLVINKVDAMSDIVWLLGVCVDSNRNVPINVGLVVNKVSNSFLSEITSDSFAKLVDVLIIINEQVRRPQSMLARNKDMFNEIGPKGQWYLLILLSICQNIEKMGVDLGIMPRQGLPFTIVQSAPVQSDALRGISILPSQCQQLSANRLHGNDFSVQLCPELKRKIQNREVNAGNKATCGNVSCPFGHFMCKARGVCTMQNPCRNASCYAGKMVERANGIVEPCLFAHPNMQ